MKSASLTLLGLMSFGLVFAAPAAAGAEDAKSAHETDAGIGAYGQAAEEIHERRFQDLLNAFKTGQSTTRYDTLAPVEGAANPSRIERASMGTIDADALKDAVDYVEDKRTSALIVYRNGAIEAEHYFGETTRETPLKSKSLAKPLGVVAIGRAMKLGVIEGLDQPAADFITEWRGTPKEKILIRHILDMRTGLLRQGFSPDVNNILNRAYLHPYHDDIIINYYPLTDLPGERYEYSNATSELVAPLIERAAGVQYEMFLQEQILKPLGAMGGNIWMNREGGTAHAGCCVQLPAETWLRLAVLVLNDGVWEQERLLPEGFVAEMKTATLQNPFAGMGLFLGKTYKEWRGVGNPENDLSPSYHSEPYLDEGLVLFDGNGNQVVYIVSSENLVILRLGERPPKETVWDNAYLPNRILKGVSDR